MCGFRSWASSPTSPRISSGSKSPPAWFLTFVQISRWGADPAVLPWDYTLNAIQNFVAGPLAHLVIIIAAICAVLGYAVAGDSELVPPIAKAVIGTGAALLAVQLLNYLAP